MTNFEKFKENLTVDKLLEFACGDICSKCPIFDSCNENDGRTCEELLTQYFESEVEDD